MGDVSGKGCCVVFLIIMFCHVLGVLIYHQSTYDLYGLFGVSVQGLCYFLLFGTSRRS